MTVEVVCVCDSSVRCRHKRIRIGNGEWRKALLICLWHDSCNHKHELPLEDALNIFGLDKTLYYASSKTKQKLGVIHKDRFVGVRLSEKQFQKITKRAKSQTNGNVSQYIRNKIT